ncbi:hypothetical protein [Deferrisoma camini]|uniref:hypothetical protein n=1 Tax=Deferrisoma camini TaxID=1035120 RepID=UPI00046D5BC7|nr:hypothetical protein [Deferrisoma camini]
MSRALKTVTVSWSWAGDPFALRGFNVAITPTGSGVHPDTHAVARGFAGPTATSYEFDNVALEVGVGYAAWVQAVYEGADSDWVNQGTVTAADDGTATIPPAHSAASGARWELAPGQYFRIYDQDDQVIFEATLSGTNQGDVFCGDLAADKGWIWDKSAGEFRIGGAVKIGATLASTVEANAADGAAAKAKLDTDVGADTIETTTGAQAKANTAEANAKAASEPRVTKSATAPSSPNADDLWLDTSATPHVWKRWDGSAWVKATPTAADEIAESATRKWAAESGADVTANNPQDYSWITGQKPPSDATRNVIYRQASQPTGAADGDLWFDTDDQLLYRYNGTSWEQIGTANVTYSQASAPTGTKGDLWYDTDDNKLYRHDGSGWQQVSTSNDIYSQSAEPSTPKKGDLWYDTSTKKLKRYNGTAWEDIGNDFTATSQLTDDAGLGQTADWQQVTGTGKPADNADVTADKMNAGVEITLAGGGIRAGKSGYSDTAAGWFIGRDTDGVPKLRIGGTTYELAWDGTELVVKGKLTVQPGSTGYDNLTDKPPLAQSLWVPPDGELFPFTEHFSSTKGVSPL